MNKWLYEWSKIWVVRKTLSIKKATNSKDTPIQIVVNILLNRRFILTCLSNNSISPFTLKSTIDHWSTMSSFLYCFQANITDTVTRISITPHANDVCITYSIQNLRSNRTKQEETNPIWNSVWFNSEWRYRIVR